MERTTKEIIVSASDFEKLENELAFLSKNELSYDELKKKFFEEAKKSNSEKSSYILWLFADMLEIRLTPDGLKYKAAFILFEKGRSMIPSDLTANDIRFLASIYENIKNNILKTRIADLLWYLKIKPKNPKYADFVISSYLKLPFSDSKNFYSNKAFLSRALYLAKQMKKNKMIEEFEKDVFSVFQNYQFDGYAYLFQLTDFMIENSLCRDNAKGISEKLDSCGETCEKNNNYNLAGSYYAHAALWAGKFDETRAIELQIKNAKSCIHHAEYVEQSENIRVSETAFYEQALDIIRNLEKDKRRHFISEEEEKNITERIRKTGQKCITSLKEFSTSIDLSECITQIKNKIKGKSKEEALQFLSLLSSNITFKNMEETAIKNIEDAPLSSMFSKQFYSSDGRIVARTKGCDLKSELTFKNENVWQQMIFTYSLHIQIHVTGMVLPALSVFTNEHTISFRELNEIVCKSTIFPNDRKGIITKGLLAGFEYDFITALHLLTPQIENMVRYQLRAANVKTSVIDKEGIENENGLSTLVKILNLNRFLVKI